MKKIVITLLSVCSLLAAGCSRPTADLKKERTDKAKIVAEHKITAEPMMDTPILAASPTPSASTPKP
jgi:hypothetical protein